MIVQQPHALIGELVECRGRDLRPEWRDVTEPLSSAPNSRGVNLDGEFQRLNAAGGDVPDWSEALTRSSATMRRMFGRRSRVMGADGEDAEVDICLCTRSGDLASVYSAVSTVSPCRARRSEVEPYLGREPSESV